MEKKIPLFACFLLFLWSVALQGQETLVLERYLVDDTSDTLLLEYHFREAYVPFLQRNGARHLQTFRSANPDSKQEYLLLYTLPNNLNLGKLKTASREDGLYRKLAAPFRNAAVTSPPYRTMERITAQTLQGTGSPNFPDQPDRIFELRIYGAPTEGQLEEEVDAFHHKGQKDTLLQLGFEFVFYAEKSTGTDLPGLVYMLAFPDMDTREQQWEAFLNSETWKNLEKDPGYQDNINSSRTLLYRALE